MATEYKHDSIGAINMQAIELEARRMRAEAVASAFRALRIWVSARFAHSGNSSVKQAV